MRYVEIDRKTVPAGPQFMGIVAHSRVACILLLTVHTRQAKRRSLSVLLYASVCIYYRMLLHEASEYRLQTKRELAHTDMIHFVSGVPGKR